MSTWLIIASGAVTLAAGVIYLRAALREARPQAVSWLIWAALLAVGACSALAAGQVPAAVYVLACAAMCAAVTVLVVRRAGWRVSRTDAACMAGASAGLVLLTAGSSPAWATVVTVAVDAIAYAPTAVHAWQAPREEPWTAYALFAAGAALALAAADPRQFTAVGYPAYLLAADMAVACVIAVRRRRILTP